MSAGNLQYELVRAYDTNEKAVAAATTIRVGRDEDFFQIDNPVNVDIASTYDITVPNGVQANQELFFFVTALTGSEAVSVKPTTPATAADLTLNAVGEWAILRWIDSTTGWVKVAYATGV